MILDDINHKINQNNIRTAKTESFQSRERQPWRSPKGSIGLPSGYDIHSLPWKITIFSGINDGIPSGSDMTFTVCELEKSLINGGI